MRMTNQSGSFANPAAISPPLKWARMATTLPTIPQRTTRMPPQRIDFFQVDVPRPTELKGKRSPRRIMSKSAMTHSQMSDSFQSVPVKLKPGKKSETAQRTINIPNSAMNRPTQVIGEVFDPVAEEEVI